MHDDSYLLEDETRRLAESRERGGEATSRSPLKVLVADDSEINQLVTRRMLERLGCTVDAVENGRLAIDAIARDTYDVVLMDVQMPVLDGFSATRFLREQGGPLPWIVALTANAVEGDRERCLEAGMDAYLTKPLRLAALEAELRRIDGRATNG